MKRSISVLLAVVLLILSAAVFTGCDADDAPTSGSLGDNAAWLIKDKVLIITGTGNLIDCDKTQPWKNSTALFNKVVISEGITGLGSHSFYKLDNFTEVQLPSTLKTIGKNAFCDSRALNKVTIPFGVESIGTKAFYATKITSVTVPDSVTYLGSFAFENCYLLETVKLSDSLTTINQDMFQCNYALKEVTLPRNLQLICQNAFSGCSELESITLPLTVAKINKGAFANCTGLKSINLPEGVKISSGAFDGTPNLDPITKIVKQPADVQVAAAGDEATVTVSAAGEELKYNWFYRNQGETEWKKAGAHTASYTTAVTKARYGRQVYCEVVDKFKRITKTKSATLTFDTGLKITQQPVDVTVEKEGDTAEIKIVAEGTGKTYTWYYKNPNWEKWSKSSCTKSTYKIAVKGDRYGRQVYCIVRDKYGMSIKSDVITLKYKKE